MISRWNWILSLLTRRLWFRAGLFGVAALATALITAAVSPLMPWEISNAFGADAVEDILRILASSMLAVTTFSLGTMVSAFAAAASTATPRASKLLIEDTTSQNVLSTFIGAFIFSLVGIIALNTHLYGDGERTILFVVTLLVITFTLATLFRWIDYLSHLGRLGETVEKVEAAALASVQARCRNPHLGSRPARELPSSVFALTCDEIGYVQHLDVAALDRIARNAGGAVHVNRLPGAFVDSARPLAWTTWQPDESQREKLLDAFLVGKARSFEQDPRFGLIVMSEIASRALSPGINDPGTAIDVIGRIVRVLSLWAKDPGDEADEVRYEHVFIPAITTTDLFDDVFTPIARDGAGNVEVGVRLQKAFRSLAAMGGPEFRENARRHSALALARGRKALQLDEEKRVVEGLAAEVA